MRRMLHVLKWLGLSLSTLLLAGTVFCWVRSLGHVEGWEFSHFEPNPHVKTGAMAGQGTRRWWSARAIHGQLWLGSQTWAPAQEWRSEFTHERKTISADEAKQAFESFFQPGEQSYFNGVQQNWSFAGAAFHHGYDRVAPETGRPRVEGFALALPFWLLTVVFGLCPVCFVARRVLGRRRYGAGLCPQCGYDLRATPDRCPECGRTVAEPRG